MLRLTLFLRRESVALAGLLILVLIVSLPNLSSSNIDDLDSAHHLMDGYFFHDLIRDHPHARLGSYVFNYYKQYPALGFIFWPPLFPFVLGIFCLFGGDHVLTGRACIFFFGCLFTVSFYFLLRRNLSPWVAWCATAAGITSPGLIWSFNQIMLELPTLAMMNLAALSYFSVRDHVKAPANLWRGFLCGAALASVVYTKQPAYFLYGAIATDALQVRPLFRRRETWVAILTLIFLCVPLLIFTLKFGHANLAQSVGSNTTLIMKGYTALPRWSLAAWSFYPKLALSLLNPLVLFFGLGSLLLATVSLAFRRNNMVWLAWFVLAYLTFSFYDNRLARHSTFWWPSWIALAGGCLEYARQRVSIRYRQILPLLFLLPIPWQLTSSWHQDYSDFREQRPLVAKLFASGNPGNVLLFGSDKQTFVELIREYDHERQVHILRGDALLDGNTSLEEICRMYRIHKVLVELPPAATGSMPSFPATANKPSLHPLADEKFLRRGQVIKVLEFDYLGPIDPVMADVPLSGKLL